MLKACYENHKSSLESFKNFKTDSPVQNYFLTCKNSFFESNESRAGCPKLGHTILFLPLQGSIQIVGEEMLASRELLTLSFSARYGGPRIVFLSRKQVDKFFFACDSSSFNQ